MSKLLCDKEVRQMLADIGLPHSRKTLQNWIKSGYVPKGCFSVIEPSGRRRWDDEKTRAWVYEMVPV